jgi:hypothetical protein
MVENIDITSVTKKLNAEFEELIDERAKIHQESAKLKARGDEIDRKLAGIQTTLRGLLLYVNAQEAPAELMKKAPVDLEGMLGGMNERVKWLLPTVDVRKTLSECCRDILRQKKDWMSPVQVRDALFAAGFDFSSYTSNPLSSIHTTLKRLVPAELDTETRADGQVYRWNTIEVKVGD